MKPEGEEEAEFSAGEDADTLSGVGGVDQSVGCIVCFANVVKLYQRKNQNCFQCGSPEHLMKDCPKVLSKTTQKVSLNVKEGRMKNGGWAINAVTTEFVKVCSLNVGLLRDLANGTLGINGFGGEFSKPFSYIIIRVQVEGVRGYDEDQVALVIPDSTIFVS